MNEELKEKKKQVVKAFNKLAQGSDAHYVCLDSGYYKITPSSWANTPVMNDVQFLVNCLELIAVKRADLDEMQLRVDWLRQEVDEE